MTLPFIVPKAPELKTGDRIIGDITSIDQVEGPEGKMQLEFSFTSKGVPKGKAWLAYYDRPSEKSKIAQLCETTAKATGEVYQSVDETMKALQKRGRIYLRCDGHKEYRGNVYPKLKIVLDELPEPFDTHNVQPVMMSEEELRKREQERLGKN